MQEGFSVLDHSRLNIPHAKDSARGGVAPPFRCVTLLSSL